MLDPRTHHPTNSFHLYDGTRNETQSDDNTWEATNSGLWPSKTAENHYRSLSPASRTQAIARGQRELMEMVKNMPESNYELSLKDIVEHHHTGEATATQENKVEKKKNLSVYRRDGSSRKVDKMGQVKRNGNIDRGGFYLKVGFPFSLGSKDKKNKNKKKNESSGNSSSKVSPRPPASDGSGKCVDKEWWKKSPSAMRDSESGESSINSESMKSSGSSSSSNSNSSRRSNSRREKSGRRCWAFFIRRPKSQTKK